MTNTANTDTITPDIPDVSTTFTVGEGHGKQPGGRRFTMTHANDGVVVQVSKWETFGDNEPGAWYLHGSFELFADEVDAFATKLAKIARNEVV
jgi:hypothetical protein